jgi:hypothetical protein
MEEEGIIITMAVVAVVAAGPLHVRRSSWAGGYQVTRTIMVVASTVVATAIITIGEGNFQIYYQISIRRIVVLQRGVPILLRGIV